MNFSDILRTAIYALRGNWMRSALTSLGVWGSVAEKLVRAENVRVALTYVARGEAEMAIQQFNVSKPVAGTDYVGHLPDDLHEYVVFAIAIATGSKEREAACALIEFVTSPEAAPLLHKAMMEPAAG